MFYVPKCGKQIYNHTIKSLYNQEFLLQNVLQTDFHLTNIPVDVMVMNDK